VRRVLAAAALAVVVGGCTWMPWKHAETGTVALERADDLARSGAWEDAVNAYGQYLALYPDAEHARRAAASRDTLRALLTARAEVARLREEVARLRDELGKRDSDLVKIRLEAERLRTDLERMKQIDFKLERRR
jgi:HAMP domain-containing protein